MRLFAALFAFAITLSAFADEKINKKEFVNDLRLGIIILHREKMVPNFKWIGLDRQLRDFERRKNTTEPDFLAIENLIVVFSTPYFGVPYAPNYGWGFYSRKQYYPKRLEVRFRDWNANADALKRFDMKVSVQNCIDRVQYAMKNAKLGQHKVVLSDPVADQAASFYKRVADEKIRIAAEALQAERKLDSYQKTAGLRKNLGWSGDLPSDEALKKAIAQWKQNVNNGNFTGALKQEQLCRTLFAEQEKVLYAKDGNVPAVRPGVSFHSAGHFGFIGDWQPLLNFQAQTCMMFRKGKQEFIPYQLFNQDWSVVFEPAGAQFREFFILDGSWNYSHRKTIWRKMAQRSKVNVETWWSALAPGLLFDMHDPKLRIADTSLGTPEAPHWLSGMFNGKFETFEKGSKIPFAQMSEGWLLLQWKNPAPKTPILLYFANRPDSAEFTENGLIFKREKEIGKFAAAPLFGAAPVDPDTFVKDPEQCRKIADLLAFFPLDADEFYINGNGECKVWNFLTKYIDLSANWERKAKPYMPLPPVYSLALAGGAPIKVDQPLGETLQHTRYGQYRVVPGNQISYTLPLPDLLERIVLKPSGEEALIKEYNQIAQMRGQALQPEKMDGRQSLTSNIFNEALGAFAGLAMMDRDTKKVFSISYRAGNMLDQMFTGEEFYGSRCREHPENIIPDYLVDPSTGKGGWVAGWRGNRQNAVMRGDMTCFNMELLAGPYAWSVIHGDWTLFDRYWPRIKNFWTAVPFSQTWFAPGMNTTTSGLILSVDMYGDGFRCYNIMYRLARAMRDPVLENDARYLAAKHNMVTFALLSSGMEEYNRSVRNTGESVMPGSCVSLLGLDGEGLITRPWFPNDPKKWNAPFQSAGCMIWDYPFFGSMLRYMPAESQAWIDRFMKDVPKWCDKEYISWCGENRANAWNTIKWLAFTTRDSEKLRDLYRKNLSEDFLKETPPNKIYAMRWRIFKNMWRFSHISRAMNVLPHLIGQNDPVWIGALGRARLFSGEYDRNTRLAEVKVYNDTENEITMVSIVKPSAVTVNGKPFEAAQGEWEYEYRFNLPAGLHTIRMQLPEFSVKDFGFPAKAKLPAVHYKPAPKPGKLPGTLPRGNISIAGKTRMLDLSKFCNSAVQDQPETVKPDIWKVPEGETLECGVPFHYVSPAANGGKGVIFLGGTARPNFPNIVKNIPVNARVRRVFFLHGVCYQKPGLVLTYRMNFADGQTRDVKIFAGRQIGDWKVPQNAVKAQEIAEAQLGKRYPAGKRGQWGHGVGGYVYTWTNDVLGKGITAQGSEQRSLALLKSIDIISAGESVPIIFAITTEE